MGWDQSINPSILASRRPQQYTRLQCDSFRHSYGDSPGRRPGPVVGLAGRMAFVRDQQTWTEYRTCSGRAARHDSRILRNVTTRLRTYIGPRLPASACHRLTDSDRPPRSESRARRAGPGLRQIGTASPSAPDPWSWSSSATLLTVIVNDSSVQGFHVTVV